MREWTVTPKRNNFAGAALLVSSVVFLVASVSSNLVIRQQISSQRAANSINGKNTAAAMPLAPDTSSLTAPAPAETLNPELTKGLNQELNKWIAKQSTKQQWGITARSLDDDSLDAAVHADQSFQSASIYKLYVVYGLAQTVPFSKWSKLRTSTGQTYVDCVRVMMVRSDNPCGTALGSKVGWSKLTTILDEAGYAHTNLKADPMTTTPSDTTQLLTNLYNHDGFDDDTATFVLGGMSQSSFKKGIVAGCPDCQVANKTGDFGGYLHDTGIVTISGKHYVLTIFSRGGSQVQIADVTRLVRGYLL